MEIFTKSEDRADTYHNKNCKVILSAAILDDCSSEAKAWFKNWHFQLRHVQNQAVLKSLGYLINSNTFQSKDLETFEQAREYLDKHNQYIHYQYFKQKDCPLSSGMLESACKWLI